MRYNYESHRAASQMTISMDRLLIRRQPFGRADIEIVNLLPVAACYNKGRPIRLCQEN